MFISTTWKRSATMRRSFSIILVAISGCLLERASVSVSVYLMVRDGVNLFEMFSEEMMYDDVCD